MAKIEELIGEIADPRIRAEIAAEVKRIKAQKKFGLVFEEHLPETVRLPGFPVRAGELVAERGAAGNDLWFVRAVKSGKAQCRRPEGNYGDEQREIAVKDLVVVKRFGEAVYPALVPVDRVAGGGPEKPWHTLINADNFHALQLLLYSCEGQVDMIYIDPPYNTGARDWKYNNDYVDKADSWRHSKWLSMMKKRLQLAKRLLKPDGVLVVTIDDYENASLSSLLDSLFPEFGRFTITVRYNRSGSPRLGFFRVHEYVHLLTVRDLERPTSESYITSRNFRYNGVGSTRADRPSMFYPVYIDKKTLEITGFGEPLKSAEHPRAAAVEKVNVFELWPIDDNGNERRWSWAGPSVMRRKGELIVSTRNGGLPRISMRTANMPIGFRESVWVDPKFDAATHGSSLVQQIVGERFPFPKSLYAVREIIWQVTHDRTNALIVDFFAGSGTTFHAASLLNAEDGGSRRCILVTNNEVEEKTAKHLHQRNLFQGDADFEKKGIAEAITWPRCKFATMGKRDDGSALHGEYLNGRSMADGFAENIEYFKLQFLDPGSVAMGRQFEAILPILWMKAGCRGARESSRGSTPWFIPKESSFAVLIKEQKFAAFRKELAGHEGITHVFLVTDSEENFRAMTRTLRRDVQTVQLYKSYLENFSINTELLAEA